MEDEMKFHATSKASEVYILKFCFTMNFIKSEERSCN